MFRYISTIVCAGLFAMSVQAEIIERVNPDGSKTIYVPQAVPSRTLGPCEAHPYWTPATLLAAHDAYQASLRALRQYPTDVMCRTQALRLGKHFLGMSRQGKVTDQDEQILLRDVDAALR